VGTVVTEELGAFMLRVLAATASIDGHDEIIWWTREPYAPITFLVLCNDVFDWGTADCEPLTPDNIYEFEQAIADVRAATQNDTYASMLFCARRRKQRPQGACYPSDRGLWPLLDACGPERETGLGNPYRPGQRLGHQHRGDQ
jgi:hypothetical protein